MSEGLQLGKKFYIHAYMESVIKTHGGSRKAWQ